MWKYDNGIYKFKSLSYYTNMYIEEREYIYIYIEDRERGSVWMMQSCTGIGVMTWICKKLMEVVGGISLNLSLIGHKLLVR